MKIFWFTEAGIQAACSRHRAYIYQNPLVSRGIRVRYRFLGISYSRLRARFRRLFDKVIKIPVLSRLLSTLATETLKPIFNVSLRLWDFLSMLTFQKIIFQRYFPSRRLLALLKILGKNVYFDFDDALFLRPPPKTPESPEKEGADDAALGPRIRKIITRSHGVFVSNPYLADWVSRYNPKVTVIPTSAEMDESPRREKADSGEFIIGWMGAVENQKYLKEIFPGIRRFLDRFETAWLHVVTRNHWKLDHPRVRYISWELETYQAEISRFDLGLAPLSDTPWTRGKMQFKAIQYAARGVPVVGSPVGFNPEHWRHDENVLFAASPGDVADCLVRLQDDPGLRWRIGRAGHETVKRFYSPEVNAAILVQALLK